MRRISGGEGEGPIADQLARQYKKRTKSEHGEDKSEYLGNLLATLIREYPHIPHTEIIKVLRLLIYAIDKLMVSRRN